MAMPNLRAGSWTLEQMHALPDDGNRYELVHGQLLVTPAPTYDHQSIVETLAARLRPYVDAHGLGRIHFPRSVIRSRGSETEPDLMVRPKPATNPRDWEAAPLPIFIAEVLSDASRRGDRITKRGFYLELEIPDYWILDGHERTIRIVRPGLDDVVMDLAAAWHPAGVALPLMIDIANLFAEALGPS